MELPQQDRPIRFLARCGGSDHWHIGRLVHRSNLKPPDVFLSDEEGAWYGKAIVFDWEYIKN